MYDHLSQNNKLTASSNQLMRGRCFRLQQQPRNATSSSSTMHTAHITNIQQTPNHKLLYRESSAVRLMANQLPNFWFLYAHHRSPIIWPGNRTI